MFWNEENTIEMSIDFERECRYNNKTHWSCIA